MPGGRAAFPAVRPDQWSPGGCGYRLITVAAMIVRALSEFVMVVCDPAFSRAHPALAGATLHSSVLTVGVAALGIDRPPLVIFKAAMAVVDAAVSLSRCL